MKLEGYDTNKKPELRKLFKLRIAWVFIIMSVALSMLLGRLVFLQILNNEHYSQMAQAQRLRPTTLDPQRGVIFDRNFKTLAISVGANAVYAIPSSNRDDKEAAQKLASILAISASELQTLLDNKAQASTWLARKLTPDQAQSIKELDIPGIRMVQRPQRFYPNGTLAAHVLGIAGVDNQGLEGLEYQYNEILRGNPGSLERERDAAQRDIPGGSERLVPPEDGYDLVLTLDSVIQYIAEKEIRNAVQATGSARGVILIMDPRNGEILANAVYPTFDPNEYQNYSLDTRRNVAIIDQYEPGSTFKVITASAGWDLGIVTADRQFTSENYWEVGGGAVRNWDGRGSGAIPFSQAVEDSDNIVFAKLAVEIGPSRFYPYIRSFGFGAKLGVDFPGEAVGTVPAPGEIRYGETLQWANIGFGQGIAVTPLQLLTAVSSVANGGNLLQPHFVKEIRDKSGRLIEQTSPRLLGKPVTAETAEMISRLLRSVVVNGTGNRADIAGYFVAGKTGTAEVAEAGGYGDKRIASFVGFAPVDEPQVATIVLLYEPQGDVQYGGVLSAPIFQSVVEQTLEHLRVQRRRVPTERGAMTIVPNVRNFPLIEAQVSLAQANLQWNYHGAGAVVMNQVPSPGSRVPPQTTVNLFFYQAGNEKKVEVPSVIGLSMRDASAVLAEGDLRLRIIGSGMAKKQTPQPGTVVPAGSVIEVEFLP